MTGLFSPGLASYFPIFTPFPPTFLSSTFTGAAHTQSTIETEFSSVKDQSPKPYNHKFEFALPISSPLPLKKCKSTKDLTASSRGGGGGGGGSGGGGDGEGGKGRERREKGKRGERGRDGRQAEEQEEERENSRVKGKMNAGKRSGKCDKEDSLADDTIIDSVVDSSGYTVKAVTRDSVTDKSVTRDSDTDNSASAKPFHFNDGRRFIFANDSGRKKDFHEEDMNFLLYEKQKAVSRIALLSTDSR